jgi:hypothetical protein
MFCIHEIVRMLIDARQGGLRLSILATQEHADSGAHLPAPSP